MAVTLVLQEIDVLVAVHALEVIPTNALAEVMLLTVDAAEHAAVDFAKRSSLVQ